MQGAASASGGSFRQSCRLQRTQQGRRLTHLLCQLDPLPPSPSHAADWLAQAHLDAVGAALAARGEEAVWGLLAAECDTCPRHLMRTAADCLFRLLSHPAAGGAAQGWLSAALASGRLPGCASGALSVEDCSTFAALALGGGVRGARFAALVVDFGLLARGQNTSDVLLAYQM